MVSLCFRVLLKQTTGTVVPWELSVALDAHVNDVISDAPQARLDLSNSNSVAPGAQVIRESEQLVTFLR